MGAKITWNNPLPAATACHFGPPEALPTPSLRRPLEMPMISPSTTSPPLTALPRPPPFSPQAESDANDLPIDGLSRPQLSKQIKARREALPTQVRGEEGKGTPNPGRGEGDGCMGRGLWEEHNGTTYPDGGGIRV